MYNSKPNIKNSTLKKVLPNSTGLSLNQKCLQKRRDGYIYKEELGAIMMSWFRAFVFISAFGISSFAGNVTG
jgi:hypothetical protein